MESLRAGLQKPGHLHAGDRVQISRGLIAEKNRRLHQKRPGDRRPLLLSSRQSLRQTLQLVIEPQKRNDLLQKFSVDLRSVKPQREHDILIHTEHGDKIILLKDKTDIPSPEDGPLLFIHVFQTVSPDPYAAGCRDVQPSEKIEKRRLAAAGSSDDRQELSVLRRQRHPVQSMYLIGIRDIIFLQIYRFYHFHSDCLLF